MNGYYQKFTGGKIPYTRYLFLTLSCTKIIVFIQQHLHSKKNQPVLSTVKSPYNGIALYQLIFTL